MTFSRKLTVLLMITATVSLSACVTVAPADFVNNTSVQTAGIIKKIKPVKPTLVIPAGYKTPKKANYSVIAGDTLYGIAQAKCVTLRSLADLNAIDAPYAMTSGQTLNLPRNAC